MSCTPTAHKTILVVEDDFFIRDLLIELLEEEGYPVASAANGQEALAYLETATELPALILLDLMMPVMDGQQFLQRQQRDLRLQPIPVVVLTASTDNTLLPEEFEPTGYMAKPIELHRLLDTVATYSHSHDYAHL
jgi:CheY-like chemotaxis protein